MPSGGIPSIQERLRRQRETPDQQAISLQSRLRQYRGTPVLDPAIRARNENTEYGTGWKTLDGVFLALQEMQRPQKALFAGFDSWLNGSNTAEAFSIAEDELLWGRGTGNFKRDISGYDLLRNITTPKGDAINRVSAMGGMRFEQFMLPDALMRPAGLAVDVVADPINLLPIGIMASWVGRMARGGGAWLSRSASRVPVVGPLKEQVVDWVKQGFSHALPGDPATRAAQLGETQVGSLMSEHAEVIADDFVRDSRSWRKIVEETGLSDTELGEIVTTAAAKTKIVDPALLPEATENTMARIYRDYGLEGYNRWMETAGRRVLTHEQALRRTIFNAKLPETLDEIAKGGTLSADAEKIQELRNMDVFGELEQVIFDMKERGLERFAYTREHLRKTSDIADPVFESLTRDYIRIAPTRAFREAIEAVGLGPRSQVGFGLNPFSTSDLHSTLQEMGIDKANQLLRTPNPKKPGLSQFFVRHPETNERIYMPVLEQGFHTDPRLIDGVREMYARRAVESSIVLQDLVRGFGKVLDDTLEVPVFDNFGQEVLDPTTGLPQMKMIQVWADSPQMARARQALDQPGGPRAGRVSESPGRLQAMPGEAVTQEARRWSLTNEASEYLENEGLVLLRGLRGFENSVLPKEAADIVMGVNAWRDPKNAVARGLLNALNTVQNTVWKPMTLFLFPGYFARNVVTNTFLQHSMGMGIKDIVHYNAWGTRLLSSGSHANRARRAIDATARAMGKGGDSKAVFTRHARGSRLVEEGKPLADSSIRLDDLVGGISYDDLPLKDDIALLHLATELGVVRSGQYGSGEVLRSLETMLETAGKSTARRFTGITVNTNAGLAAGADAAQFLEDSQRLGAFLWALENKGMSVLEARDFAIRHMVDFNAMTGFERNVLRKYFIPFYSWARNSTPLMAESFIHDNAKWRVMNKIIQDQERAVAEQDGILPDRLVPEYIARGLNVPVSRDPETGEYRFWLLDGWIPQSQLTDIDSVEELMKFIPENLGPLVKTPLEIAFGESLFLERDFGLGNRDYLGLRMPEWAITVLRNVRLLNTADWLISAETPQERRDAFFRFATGFNRVRLTKGQASQIYSAKLRREEQRTAAAVLEAGRSGNRDEIQALFERLQRFKMRGR